MRVAVVFPGQGTQVPGMGMPWRDHPAWSIVDRAEAALGEPLASLLTDASADVLARTRNSQLAVLLTSLVAWEAMQPLADATGRVRRPLARAGHRARSRRAHSRWKLASRFAAAAGRAHAGRRRRASRPDGRTARSDDRAGRGRVRGRPGRMLGRERQRARTSGDRRHARRARARDRYGPRSSG